MYSDKIIFQRVMLVLRVTFLLVSVEAALEAKAEVLEATRISETESNLVGPPDTYSLYKEMMEMKQLLGDNSTIPSTSEPETITRLKNALSLLYDALVDGWFFGFIPHFERQRREARYEDRKYLDLLVISIGAILGKQNCSNMVACRLKQTIE